MCQGKQGDKSKRSKQYKQVCKSEFTSIHAKLDKLDEAIRGNGKPGIQLRLDRLETAQANRSRVLWLVIGVAVTLAVGGLWKLAAGGL
jgi:hypothetical protein